MATRRVIAHCTHETELFAAKQKMTSLAETESYIVGDADDAAIAEMESAGILIEELPEIEQESSPFEMAFGMAGPGQAEAGHYTITFLFPLTEEVREKLKALDVVLLRHMPPSGYLAYLNADQVDAVQSLPAVAAVRLFGADATGPAFESLTTAAFESVTLPQNTESYEVRPSRREDVAPLLDWLNQENVTFERKGLMVRITVPAGSTIPQEIQKLDPALTVLPIEPIFDLRLHDATGREPLETWLKEEGVNIIGSTNRKIRVRLDGDDGTKYDAIRSHDLVFAIDPYNAPYVENDAARILLGVDRRNNQTVVQNIQLTGKDEIIGVADTGIDDQHPDLKNRIQKTIPRGRPGDASDPHGHGTHVSGSIAGDGTASNGAIRGVAPDAKLVVQSLLDAKGRLGGLPLDLNDLLKEAYDEGVRIHNNSWGTAFSGEYNVDSEEVDEFIYNNPDMLVVISAGNEGSAAQNVNSDKGFVDLGSLGVPATAKNALTVGASRSDRTSGGYAGTTYKQTWGADYPDPPIGTQNVSGDPEEIAAFSSRGPCTDQRMKPDVVAPGTDIVSARSSKASTRRYWGLFPTPPDTYAYMGGTSMAAPLVAGCAALVREYYRTKRNHLPSAALLKSTLINGARFLSGVTATANHAKLPNYHQGFGFLNMTSVLPQDANPAFALEFIDGWKNPDAQFVINGQKRRFIIETDADGPLRLCLAWTDPPASGLQNKLHLMLEDQQTKTKFQGNDDRPKLLKGPDSLNNVQVVRIDNAPAGKYLIQVWNTVLLRTPQAFSLVVTGRISSGPLTLF